MTLRTRKLVVICGVAAVFVLANAAAIVAFLQRTGVVGLAKSIRRGLLTGTAVAVIAVLLWLMGPNRSRHAGRTAKSCRVCDRAIPTIGRYCPHCGSRT